MTGSDGVREGGRGGKERKDTFPKQLSQKHGVQYMSCFLQLAEGGDWHPGGVGRGGQ